MSSIIVEGEQEVSDQIAEVGVFGGSGFYKLLENYEEKTVETPYGPTSGRIAIGTLAGKKVAFMPRHGADHQYPPHRINYRANVWAMKSLGVTRLIAPCAAGSLQKDVKPGDFVVCDQFVDRTSARKDTFYDGPVTTHVSAADPYCKELRGLTVKAGKDSGITMHDKGTVVVIQGPRFSTRSESAWFSSQGWEVINMTQYPEVHLAREVELCVVNISLITDYDCGLEGNVDPVSHSEVVKVFAENNSKLLTLLTKLISSIPAKRTEKCNCAETLKGARL
ncbi:MAG: S-methyl-5'-thioadenosine phosphorylase [Candidatus Obscuribacterales bacterium]|nr:S-methyl-5'-thioadenosine phosphorylase [Candidatus Obscuribacterales bacterium]